MAISACAESGPEEPDHAQNPTADERNHQQYSE
jgi:hypothetical protein